MNVSHGPGMIQMESKNDLRFVFNSLKAAIKPQINKLSGADQNNFEQAFEEIFKYSAVNCLVNNKPYNDVSDAPIQEYEPVDQNLIDELSQLQLKVDRLITNNCEMRRNLIVNTQQDYENILSDNLIQFAHDHSTGTYTDENEDDENLDRGNYDGKNAKRLFHESLEMICELQRTIPPLLAKSQRYKNFINEELSDEKYQQHVARLEKSNQHVATDFESAFKLKLSESFVSAVSSAYDL